MGFDIGRFESKKFAEEGVDFQLDNGLPVTIKLGGADSARIKAAVRERQKRRRDEAERLPAGVAAPEYDWKMREDDMIEDLVTLTFGWSQNLEMDGQTYQFSKENAEKLYRRFPEIAEQMTAKASNRINFMLASSTK